MAAVTPVFGEADDVTESEEPEDFDEQEPAEASGSDESSDDVTESEDGEHASPRRQKSGGEGRRRKKKVTSRKLWQ